MGQKDIFFKVTCDCGMEVYNTNLKRHHKSTFHLCYLKDLEIQKEKRRAERYKRKYLKLKDNFSC